MASIPTNPTSISSFISTLYERRDDTERGRHLVASDFVPKGSLVFCERPLLLQQNLTNTREAFICHACHCFVGDANVAMHHRFYREDSKNDENDTLMRSIISCRHNCGYVYCSKECERLAWQAHHQFLCTGAIDSMDHPLIQFKVFASETNEILLLVAQWWVAQHAATRKTPSSLSSEADGKLPTPSECVYEDFVMEAWWDVSVLDLDHEIQKECLTGDCESDMCHRLRREKTETRVVQQKICITAATLLNQALSPFQCFPLISSIDVAERIGACCQNALGFRSRHPLCRAVFDVDFRRKWHVQLIQALHDAGFLDQDGNSDDEQSRCVELLRDCTEPEQDKIGEDKLNLQASEGNVHRNNDDEIDFILSKLFIDEDDTILDQNMENSRTKMSTRKRTRDATGDDLDYVFPPLDGTALFSIACKMNHSCDPNIVVLFKRSLFGSQYPLTAYCVAIRDIPKYQELTISYIENDQPYVERQLALSCYGFACRCSKCELDLAFLRDPNFSDTKLCFIGSTMRQELIDIELFGPDSPDIQNTIENIVDDTVTDACSLSHIQSGVEALDELLGRLNSRSNLSIFGSVPHPYAAQAFAFIIRIANATMKHLRNGIHHSPVLRNLSKCLDGARERDFCLCNIAGFDLEDLLYRQLCLAGRWINPHYCTAYYCSVVAVALSCAHEGHFLEALKYLDKGMILGLDRSNHSLRKLVSYVELHAREQAVGPMHPSLSNTIPDYLCTKMKEEVYKKGLVRPITFEAEVQHGSLSQLEFISQYLMPSRHVIIRGYATGWTARSSMSSLHHLAALYGHRMIPVEIGSMMTRGTSSIPLREEIMTFRRFVDLFLVPSTNHGVWSFSDAVELSTSGVAYMAQHPLMEQIPALREEGFILNPDLLSTPPVHVNMWVGTGGTRTPLHFDSYDNLLVQLVGVKYVRLYSVEDNPNIPLLVVSSIESKMFSFGLQRNMSSLNCEDEIDDAVSAALYREVLLFPGDCLFIPSRVWHYVRSLTTSVSVNYWFD